VPLVVWDYSADAGVYRITKREKFMTHEIENGLMYEIEKNIPMKTRGKYPFNEMEVGDSFFVPNPFHNKARQAALARNGKRYRKRAGKTQRFVTRTAVHMTATGVRIWRVE
jgi:hypothetical protein